MEPTQYYMTTLTNAFTKIGPMVAFAVVGYFIFFKLPFLFFMKNMKKTKEDFGIKPEVKEVKQESYSVHDYERFVRQKKRIEAEEPLRLTDGKQEEKKASAEVLFEIKPGQKLSKDDLKKKYHDLLKANHPDKVASLSPEFKNLADKRTKDINDAYTKLLKRAV